MKDENLSELSKLREKIIAFRDARDWAQFHNPKDLAISLSLEAAELLEIFQWKNSDEVKAIVSEEKSRKKVMEELGDIMIYSLLLTHEFDINPEEVILKKLKINEKKYPVSECKGKSDKYTEY